MKSEYVRVPVEPTDDMITASRQALGKYILSLSAEEREKTVGKKGGFRLHDESLKAKIRYKAMIAAAPKEST